MKTTKQQTSKPDAAIQRAFTLWMTGTGWTVLKAKLKRPLRAAFTTLAGTTTWKQAKAARDKTVQKRGAA